MNKIGLIVIIVSILLLIVIISIGILVIGSDIKKENLNTGYGEKISNLETNKQSVPSENLNHISENVTIEIDSNTITPESISIVITRHNDFNCSWGKDFIVQQKVEDKWVDLKTKSDNLTWPAIGYESNGNKQSKQKLNIEKYYGKLKKGIYRIVKSFYDIKYTYDIYSNEFEIK